jgi:hypothetical protein
MSDMSPLLFSQRCQQRYHQLTTTTTPGARSRSSEFIPRTKILEVSVVKREIYNKFGLILLIAFNCNFRIRQHIILFCSFEINRVGLLCNGKGLKKAEMENKKRTGHVKVTFLIKVKAEGISLSCWLKLEHWRFGHYLSMSPNFLEGQVNTLCLAWGMERQPKRRHFDVVCWAQCRNSDSTNGLL